MAHILTSDVLARFHDAFARWDTTSAGTIDAGDLCEVLRFLGEAPSVELQQMCELLDGQHERITFTEFLDVVVSSLRIIPAIDDELLQIIAARDDGSGFVCFRNLMRTLHVYLDNGGCILSDDDLIEVYRQILDVSLFKNSDGTLDPEAIMAIFEDEFNDLRRKYQIVDYDAVGNREVAIVTYKPPGRHHRDCHRQDNDQFAWIDLTVVDFGGNQLLSGTFVSSSSVAELQQHVEKTVGLPVDKQSLFLAGHGALHRRSSLFDAGVVDGSTLMLVRKVDFQVDYARFLSEFMQAYCERWFSI